MNLKFKELRHVFRGNYIFHIIFDYIKKSILSLYKLNAPFGITDSLTDKILQNGGIWIYNTWKNNRQTDGQNNAKNEYL